MTCSFCCGPGKLFAPHARGSLYIGDDCACVAKGAALQPWDPEALLAATEFGRRTADGIAKVGDPGNVLVRADAQAGGDRADAEDRWSRRQIAPAACVTNDLVALGCGLSRPDEAAVSGEHHLADQQLLPAFERKSSLGTLVPHRAQLIGDEDVSTASLACGDAVTTWQR